MPLTKNGYIKRTPTELKALMVKDLEAMGSTFLDQPADIQNNILDSAVVSMLQLENITAEMLNGYAPEYANDFIWINLANSLGLTKKSKIKAQVELEFTGDAGTYIPEETSVGAFVTEQSLTLGSTGVGVVIATSEEDIVAEPNTLTEIGEIIDENLSVTNPTASIESVPAETIEELRYRARVLLRSARKGAYEYAIARLSGIKGVNNRLIKIRHLDFNTREDGPDGEVVLRNLQGIEVVVGGGDPYEIAGVLLDSFLETQKLISRPSNNEDARTARVEVKYFGNIIPISFTRPKNLPLSITINITMKNAVLNTTSALGILQAPFEKYINNLGLGETINKLTLDNIILQEVGMHGLQPRDFVAINYKIMQDTQTLEWDSQNFLPAVGFDCYLTLKGLRIEIAQGV